MAPVSHICRSIFSLKKKWIFSFHSPPDEIGRLLSSSAPLLSYPQLDKKARNCFLILNALRRIYLPLRQFQCTRKVLKDCCLSPSGFGACSSHPCYGGGTCEEHDGTFTCFCPSDRTGDRCEKTLAKSDVEVRVHSTIVLNDKRNISLFLSFQIPSFDDKAFVELRPLPTVEHKFSLEVEFRPLAEDGVILFAQQSLDGSGDFISLALKEG